MGQSHTDGQLKTEASEAPGPVTRPALHLSFPLVRLGGFAADYFRGYPSALRAAGLSEARCGGLGEAEARLITIGELDASRLESGSTGGAVLIFSDFLLLASEGERRGPRHFHR